jgi:hypothetical protein
VIRLGDVFKEKEPCKYNKLRNNQFISIMKTSSGSEAGRTRKIFFLVTKKFPWMFF